MEQKAAAARAEAERIEAELERAKYAKTHENFPNTLVSTVRPRRKPQVHKFTKTFAQKVEDWKLSEEERQHFEKLRNSKSTFERREAIRDVFIYRRKNNLSDIVLEEEDEFFTDDWQAVLEEMWPPHGPRRRYSEADAEGWRQVTPYWRHRKAKYIPEEHVLGDESVDESEEDGDEREHNGELFEDHRREFY